MHRKKIAGFSLTELMVVVGILGILATIAIPRYNSFIVQSRRAEAKSHLHQIATLQETYRAEHGNYYFSSEMSVNGVGYKDGNGNSGDCTDYPNAEDKGLSNRLGFRPKACDELRYVYKLRGPDVVIASAASDANKRHIFPDCDGAADCYECGYDSGDALALAMSNATPVVCRNITKYCPDGASCTGGVPPPPPPPPTCVCNCGWTFGTQQSSDPTKHVCEQTNLDRIDNNTCTRGPPGCVGGTPCPSPTTRTVPYVVDGAKPIDDTPPAPIATNPCGCDGTPDPRPACNPLCSSTITKDPCPPPGFDTTTKYPCDNFDENINVTTNYTPATDPPCTPPFTRTTTEQCIFPGTKPITCGDICVNLSPPQPIGNWSECIERSPGTLEKWRAVKNKNCPNPCPGVNITDGHGNSVASCDDREIVKQPCPPPDDICVAGSDSAYIGMLLNIAKNNCESSALPGMAASLTKNSTAIQVEFICNCDNTCLPCMPDHIFNQYTSGDSCDCLDPYNMLNCCRTSNLKLDEARQFLQGGNYANNECSPLYATGSPYKNQIDGLQAVVGNTGEGNKLQAIWAAFLNVGGWGADGAACYNALINHLINRDPDHPLLKISSDVYLFEATQACTMHNAVYVVNPSAGCPQF